MPAPNSSTSLRSSARSHISLRNGYVTSTPVSVSCPPGCGRATEEARRGAGIAALSRGRRCLQTARGEQVGHPAAVRQRGVDAPRRVGEPLGGGGGGQVLYPGSVALQVPGDPGAQQQRGLGDRASPGKGDVAEPLADVHQRDAFGPALQRQPGEPLQVLGEGRGPSWPRSPGSASA